ncbi:MAG: DJ-1/PfpI family protein [Lachnospiraceae bacterium]|nr:DJ-1/PfpI family protein [Lachnospiraceae bacterium]MDD3659252.1 DJ-1/PfpI family protein [Lachnospiraceae bacterium]
MSYVCVFLAEGFEEIEALTVVDLLRRVGILTDLVSVTTQMTVTGSHGIEVRADKLIEEVEFVNIDMIVLPGGMPGTKNLEECDLLMEELDLFYQQGKDISAICAAPSILGHKGFLNGRISCCYPTFESHLTGAVVTHNEVEVSGNIITSRGMGCAIAFSLAIIEKLIGKETAEDLAEKIVYQS